MDKRRVEWEDKKKGPFNHNPIEMKVANIKSRKASK